VTEAELALRSTLTFVTVTQVKAMPITDATYIHLDERDVAWIDNTNTKVIEVVLDNLAHGWSPEEIHFQHPHLSLAQIHAALGYYHDHKEELDAKIQTDLKRYQEMRASTDSPIRKRLRDLGKLS